MRNKKLVLAVIALAVLVALFAGLYFVAGPQAAAGSKTITVTVVHKDGTEKVFTCHTDEAYLGPVLTAENIAVVQDGLVPTVDGETADWNVDQGYWALYIGEEYGVLGVNDQPINDGDSFKWVYTIGF